MAFAFPTTPSFRLDERRAAITGAGRGIGQAMAIALADAGADVTLIARTETEIKATAAAISENGGQARFTTLDILNTTKTENFFNSEPAFDILINNAGTNRPKHMADVTLEDYDAVLDLNLKAAFFVAQFCSKKMMEAEVSGSLIHIGSQMGRVGGQNRSLYCASKWALEGLNKALALDLAPYSIRSNIIAPTFIETPMTKPFFDDPEFKASVLSKIKLGRLGQVSDVMGAAVFLASDASALMTGSSLLIDGGWTAD